MSEVATTYINTALRLNKSLFLPSSMQAAECNQTRAGQEDQQTAHPHCWAGKNTLSSVTISPVSHPIHQR